MGEGAYFNFDLLIERVGEKYRARVFDSPAGQASAEFEIPFSELELENFVLRMGRPRTGVRRVDSSEMEAVKQCGERLFRAVFTDDVYAAFLRSRDTALEEEKGLRVRLRIDVPEFHDYPWEFLYNAHLNQFLALSKETPIVRYLELPYPVQPLTVQPPLKILVMISSPEGFPQLNVKEEWRRLSNALAPLLRRGLVTLERLKNPTLSALQQRLRRGEYHIFHFVGHGKYSEHKQDGMLLLEEENGHGRPVSGQYLGTVLHDHRSLRLVVLNACEGARTSQEDPYAGVAQTLVLQGIPAVIAMQFEIIETAAITFAQEFYGAVADGFPVDAAVSEARKAIFATGNDVEWGTPVLYMRTPQGVIFDIPEAQRVSQSLFDEPIAYVDKELEQKLDGLYTEGLAAFYTEDWDKACQRFQTILSERPNHKNVAEKLEEAERQRNLAKLYEQATDTVRSKKWGTAIQILEELSLKSTDYKDAVQLLRNSRKQIQLRELYVEAKALHTAQQWEAVVKVFEQIALIDPTYPDADGLLPLAQKEVAELKRFDQLNNQYSHALREMDAGNWYEARRLLEVLHKSQKGFLETEKLLKKVENEIKQGEKKRKQNDQNNTLYEQAYELLRSKKWSNFFFEKIQVFRSRKAITVGAIIVVALAIILSLGTIYDSVLKQLTTATETVVSNVQALPSHVPTIIPTTKENTIELQEQQLVAWIDGSILVYVPRGKFIMGDNSGDNSEHTVQLNEFWIYRTEVTNKLYAKCVAAGVCKPPLLENYDNPFHANEPVVNVTWEQADNYCTWLQARLPTEAEWEKTARGPNRNIYPWGETPPDCDLLNFNNCIGIPSFVTDFPEGKSYYGAFDMAGNVFEWTADWYVENYCDSVILGDTTTVSQAEFRSVRGSGFLSGAQEINITNRFFLLPEESRADLGFRCVVDDPKVFLPSCVIMPSFVKELSSISTLEECPSPYVEIVSQFCWSYVQLVNIDIPDNNDGYRVVSNVGEHEIEDLACTESKENAIDPNEIRLTCNWRPEETTITVCKFCPSLASPGEIECIEGYEFDPQTSLCHIVDKQLGGACPQGFEINSELGCCKFLSQEENTALIVRNCNSSKIPLKDLSCDYIPPDVKKVQPDVKPDVKPCSSYSAQAACESAGCRWEPSGPICLDP